MRTELITRGEAAARGLLHYFTGVPCSRGHIDRRHVSSLSCMACTAVASREWYARNRRGTPSSSDTIARISKWAADNPMRVADAKARYRERHRASINASGARYRAATPAQKLAQSAKRRAAVRVATPRTECRAVIRGIFDLARHLTKITGVQHSVDHVVPLQGRTVCGLHAARNLRVVLHRDNLRKATGL